MGSDPRGSSILRDRIYGSDVTCNLICMSWMKNAIIESLISPCCDFTTEPTESLLTCLQSMPAVASLQRDQVENIDKKKVNVDEEEVINN